MFDTLIDANHGSATLLASIVIVLCLHLVLNAGKFVFGILKKKEEVSEQTIKKLSSLLTETSLSIQRLETELKRVDQDLGEVKKLRLDVRRAFKAAKLIAKDDWPKIYKAIMDEEEQIPP